VSRSATPAAKRSGASRRRPGSVVERDVVGGGDGLATSGGIGVVVPASDIDWDAALAALADVEAPY
jgi:hypothetical protein